MARLLKRPNQKKHAKKRKFTFTVKNRPKFDWNFISSVKKNKHGIPTLHENADPLVLRGGRIPLQMAAAVAPDAALR